MNTAAVIDLDDPRATDVALVGATAANLAAARAVGLPALGGVVITSFGSDRETSLRELAAHAADRRELVRPSGDSAILVQPAPEVAWSGRVMGLDPATGRHNRFHVTAFAGPAGEEVGDGPWSGTLTRIGRIHRAERHGPQPPPEVFRAVASLARRTTRAFGQPRDVPWIVDTAGTIHMLETSSASC